MINGVVQVVLHLHEVQVLSYKSKGRHFAAFSLNFPRRGLTPVGRPISCSSAES